MCELFAGIDKILNNDASISRDRKISRHFVSEVFES